LIPLVDLYIVPHSRGENDALEGIFSAQFMKRTKILERAARHPVVGNAMQVKNAR
jgi:hypothetical protein